MIPHNLDNTNENSKRPLETGLRCYGSILREHVRSFEIVLFTKWNNRTHQLPSAHENMEKRWSYDGESHGEGVYSLVVSQLPVRSPNRRDCCHPYHLRRTAPCLLLPRYRYLTIFLSLLILLAVRIGWDGRERLQNNAGMSR